MKKMVSFYHTLVWIDQDFLYDFTQNANIIVS